MKSNLHTLRTRRQTLELFRHGPTQLLVIDGLLWVEPIEVHASVLAHDGAVLIEVLPGHRSVGDTLLDLHRVVDLTKR